MGHSEHAAANQAANRTAANRTAIVTGATSGIGAAVTRRLVEDGARVVANGRRQPRLTALEALWPGPQRPVLGVVGDATDAGLIDRLFDAARRAWDRQPDLFVLCAGHGLPGTLLRSDPAKWDELFEVNCLAALRQLRACAERFVAAAQDDQREGGREDARVRDIVVIGSTIGRQVSAFNPIYGATKFALHSVVEALRQEICQHGVRVTLIEPGFVKSEFQAVAGYDPDWFRALEAEQGPFLDPADVAAAIGFVVGQPPHVHLDDIRIRPTRQKV